MSNAQLSQPAVPVSHLLPIRAAIFDMDGLIVDSEPYWRDVETDVFLDLGVEIGSLMGHGLTMGMRVDEVVAYWRSRIGFEGPPDEVIVRRIVEGVAKRISEEAKLLDGASEALDFFDQLGIPIALATGSTSPVVNAVLNRFGLSNRFQAVCSAESERLGKPHPAVFLRTAAKLGVAPVDCVVLEDSLNGVIAGKAARMRVIAVPDRAAIADVRFAIADVRLSSLRELNSQAVAAVLGFPIAKN